MTNSNATVFVFVRDGFMIRNYFRPDMIDVMANSGHRFVILSANPANPYLNSLFDRPCFKLERFEREGISKAASGGRLIDFLRRVRHFTYANTRSDQMGTRLLQLEWMFREEAASANTRLGKLFFRLVPICADFSSRWRIMRAVVGMLESKLIRFDGHRELYEKYKPSLAIFGTLGHGHDWLIMQEAKRHGARILSIVRSWDNKTSKGYSWRPVDHVFTWSQAMTDEVVQFHDVPRKIVDTIGIPGWDNYFDGSPVADRQSFMYSFGMSSDRKIIYFATGSPNMYRNNMVVARDVLEAIRDGRIHEPAQLLIRLHPMLESREDPKWGDIVKRENDELAHLMEEFQGLVAVSRNVVSDPNGLFILRRH